MGRGARGNQEQYASESRVIENTLHFRGDASAHTGRAARALALRFSTELDVRVEEQVLSKPRLGGIIAGYAITRVHISGPEDEVQNYSKSLLSSIETYNDQLRIA